MSDFEQLHKAWADFSEAFWAGVRPLLLKVVGIIAVLVGLVLYVILRLVGADLGGRG